VGLRAAVDSRLLRWGRSVAGCMVACVLVSASGAVGTFVLIFVRFVPIVSAFLLRAGAVPALLYRLAVLSDVS
jgi:hypothetical protein